ncbi:MAG: YihA family ribosome biogenesis GTP-binding protein [Prolixibacteraceae bacterium]|nr:YihA family ribosome biogenesis GTP-binding protein [Prolixibacteraceae bacterium]MBN2774867.1 YihA family ribosome biogenesis GTP-binding protein [Prolixibacteraceae bacterium]
MDIRQARFIMSNTDVAKCPAPDKPEYAFIGRSNVGKSSLINMLVNQKSLAKISGRPGKTQLINHFIINELWYLVDLPGYGYAKVSKTERKKFENFIRSYVLKRENLYCLFVLIDIRHEPQMIDLEFIEWLGMNQIPFVLVFTKADKLKQNEIEENIEKYIQKLLETWEEVPTWFITSAEKGFGRDEILDFIENVNQTNL